jgi:hypothetical protein
MRRAERDDGLDPRVRGPNYANGRIHTAAAGAVQRIFVQPRSIFRHPIQIGADPRPILPPSPHVLDHGLIGAGSAQPLGPHTASGQPPSGAGGAATPQGQASTCGRLPGKHLEGIHDWPWNNPLTCGPCTSNAGRQET